MTDALSVTSMGQASTALGTAASQHLTAVAGGHSLAEAVLLGALTLLGLIGTEHCMTPPSFVRSGGRKSLCRTYSTAGGKHSPTAAVDIRQALKISAFVIIHELFPPVNKNLKGKERVLMKSGVFFRQKPKIWWFSSGFSPYILCLPVRHFLQLILE